MEPTKQQYIAGKLWQLAEGLQMYAEEIAARSQGALSQAGIESMLVAPASSVRGSTRLQTCGRTSCLAIGDRSTSTKLHRSPFSATTRVKRRTDGDPSGPGSGVPRPGDARSTSPRRAPVMPCGRQRT